MFPTFDVADDPVAFPPTMASRNVVFLNIHGRMKDFGWCA